MGGCRLGLAAPTKAIGFVAYPVTLRSRTARYISLLRCIVEEPECSE